MERLNNDSEISSPDGRIILLTVIVRLLAKPTADGYIAFANNSGFTPEVVQLDHGAKACWMGAKDARTVVYFLHGILVKHLCLSTL